MVILDSLKAPIYAYLKLFRYIPMERVQRGGTIERISIRHLTPYTAVEG